MKMVGIVAASLLLVMLLVSCAPAATYPPAQAKAPASASTQAPAVPAAPQAKAPSPEAAWQVEWDRVVAEAKKEGGVLVYATTPAYRAPFSAAMERYGVKLELIIGSGSQTSQRILSERRGGIFSGDLISAGSDTTLTALKPKGALIPMDNSLILPEVKDPKVWFEGKLPYLDNEHNAFAFLLSVYPTLAVNTDLVKPGEIKSLNDIFAPKWQGKIVLLDPSMTGSKFINYGVDVLGQDYLRKLAAAKPTIFRDYRQPLEWLAHGKAAIIVAPHAATLAEFIKVGAPVAPVLPQEGTWLTMTAGIISQLDRAPHPNAAKVFLNWLFSKEGQTAASKATLGQSAREDVPTDFLDPLFVRDPSKKFYLFDTEEYITKKAPENMKLGKEIFKELLN